MFGEVQMTDDIGAHTENIFSKLDFCYHWRIKLSVITIVLQGLQSRYTNMQGSTEHLVRPDCLAKFLLFGSAQMTDDIVAQILHQPNTENIFSKLDFCYHRRMKLSVIRILFFGLQVRYTKMAHTEGPHPYRFWDLNKN